MTVIQTAYCPHCDAKGTAQGADPATGLNRFRCTRCGSTFVAIKEYDSDAGDDDDNPGALAYA